jgi:hypothetical protein
MRIVSLILLCSLLAACDAQAYGIYYTYDKHNYHFEISASDIAKTPEWHEGEDLPLSPRLALQSARKELGQLVGNTTSWKLSLIQITPYGDGKHWFYEVCFFVPLAPRHGAYTQEKSPAPPSMVIPILMDGATIQPKVSPVKYRP